MLEKVGTRAFRDGDTKIKEFSTLDTTQEIRQILFDKGLPIPKIKNIIRINNIFTVYSEWINGKDFMQLFSEGIISTDDYYKFGVFMGKMNNIKNEKGESASSRDLFVKNIIRTDDNKVMLCDYAKLYWTDFPEEDIVRWIINNYFLERKYKEAFMEAYLKERNVTIDYLIQKELDVNWDNYQDLYCNGKLLRNGPRSNNRLKFLPADMTGFKVLDLGCSCAMLAREAKRRGAYIVKAIDKQAKEPSHRLVDLGAIVAYAEGLDIYFLCQDIEDNKCIEEDVFDVVFCCAILGHLKGNGLEYLKMLRTKCSILYFETNLGGKEPPHRKLLEDAGFNDIQCLGESGDPERDPKNTYTMFKCKGDLQ